MSGHFRGSVGTPMTAFRPSRRASRPEHRIEMRCLRKSCQQTFYTYKQELRRGVQCPVCKGKAKRAIREHEPTLSPDLYKSTPKQQNRVTDLIYRKRDRFYLKHGVLLKNLTPKELDELVKYLETGQGDVSFVRQYIGRKKLKS